MNLNQHYMRALNSKSDDAALRFKEHISSAAAHEAVSDDGGAVIDRQTLPKNR